MKGALLLTTKEYRNYDRNSRGGPDFAFIACNEPASAIRNMAEKCGVPMDQAVFLSVEGDPSSRTPTGLFARMPDSITWMLISDVEYLLPACQRNRRAVHALMGELGRLAYLRGIVVNATHGLGTPKPPVISVHSLTSANFRFMTDVPASGMGSPDRSGERDE